MAPESFSFGHTFDADPRAVFDAIVDVRSWWSGEIDGDATRVGEQFRYRYRDLHDSTQRVDALEPGRIVRWTVTRAHLSFAERPAEWERTQIEFALLARGAQTELVFTHHGLRASCDCFDACSRGWTSLVQQNLAARVASGQAQPDVFASRPGP